MASGFFTILKNISMLMDDTASMTKIALKDTVGVLGDDLAVNAEKASKFSASRELPVIWAIIKGAIWNKILIVPLILFISYLAPWLIKPILVLGGFFLSYEGYHGIKEIFFNKNEENEDEISEDEKIKSAIRTDRVLSIEIIVIALNSVINEPLSHQIFIVSFVAFLATIGIYGIVALIIRLDDIGQWLIRKSIWIKQISKPKYKVDNPSSGLFDTKNEVYQNIYMLFLGQFLVDSMSTIIKSLTYIGIFAMFLVSGEIFFHNIPFLHHFSETINSYTLTIFSVLLSVLIGFFIVKIEESFLNYHKK